jgi:peptidoglycan/LPS O-acetylase OafA/YrhL
MNTLPSQNRIWFLQLSRAIACLFVILAHWPPFIKYPNVILKMINLPIFEQYHNVTFIGTVISTYVQYLPPMFRESIFGVGLFFLISGFIIPFSMEKISPYEFLFRRIMRIFPTVFVCVSIAAILLVTAEAISLSNVTVTWNQFIGNVLLIPNHFQVAWLEYGLWTLDIEMKFYFVCFILAFFNGHRSGLVLLFIPKIISMLDIGLIYSTYISFMLIGTCLYNWSNGKWSGKKACFFVSLLMIVNHHYLLEYYAGSSVNMSALEYTNHIYALLAFVILLLINNKIIYSKIMDKIANLSYPLYLMQGTSSYSVYFISYYLSNQTWLSILLTGIWMVSSSIFVHLYIEKPSISLSKKVIGWVKGKRSPQIESPNESTASSVC